MHKVEEKVIETITKNNLIENSDKIVVAVSGGPDSICLLDVLAKLCKPNCQRGLTPLTELVVAHVNHMIREEASEDEEFVKNFCEKIGVQFFSKSIDVKKIANNNKIGLEEAGRIARYEFFDEVMEKTGANKIAIAHNKNDKIETIIMNTLRGSGSLGLHGIQASNGKYIRPLIDCERSEIEDYCKENNIEPRIDKTNFDNSYTRNKIRNVVIPYIKNEFNPNFVETMSRLSDLIMEQDDFIDAQVKMAYENMKLVENKNEIILDLKKFNLQEKVIKSRVVLYTIKSLFGSTKGIEKIHIEDILKLCSNNIGNKYLTPNKFTKIFVNKGKIIFSKED